jgi:hypothetical protein
MEPQPHLAGGGDLGRPQIAGAPRKHVEMVGAGGAAAERQLGQSHPGREIHRLLVQARPQRVQAGQPLEQRAAGDGGIRPGEVLVQVVVGVDEAR